MQKENVEIWLKSLKDAWTSKNLNGENGVDKIFAHTEFYYEKPFTSPATNINDILKFWITVPQQNIKSLEFNILAIEGNTAIINYIFEEANGSYNGIYQIEFDELNQCKVFKRWPVAKAK